MHKRGLRQSLLLDSSQKRRTSKKTRIRNKFLNFFAKLIYFKQLKNIFRFSIVIGFIVTLMTLFLIFAIFSPYYNLKKISVDNTNSSIISRETIQNITNPFLGKNMFFLKKEKIKNSLKTKFPEISEIIISEKWPSEIEIKIKVNPAKYNIFNEKTANFISITNNGITVTKNSTEGLPVIKILQYDKPINLHENIISADWLRKIDLAEDILKQEIKLPIKEIRLLTKSRELHFITNRGTVIWVDLAQSIEAQLKKLILAEGKIKLYSKPFKLK
jgi:hypothetical protein